MDIETQNYPEVVENGKKNILVAIVKQATALRSGKPIGFSIGLQSTKTLQHCTLHSHRGTVYGVEQSIQR